MMDYGKLLYMNLNLSNAERSVVIPYLSDEQADAETKNSQLKLLFRRPKFYILADGLSAD
jgi:hypothetical protein